MATHGRTGWLCVIGISALEELAANGSLIHNDDTVLRIVDTIRHNRQNPDKKRTDMYTTDILAQNGALKIALFYNSLPAMIEAKAYIEQRLSSKQVEPNESLGKAIKYMLKHWEKLTRFLQIPGAPIHNNDMERGLKIPIRGRNT